MNQDPLKDTASNITILNITNYLHGLLNPEVQCRILNGSPVIPILRWINPISRIDFYSFKIQSNIFLPIALRLPKDIFPLNITPLSFIIQEFKKAILNNEFINIRLLI